jgi:hypothetical protein
MVSPRGATGIRPDADLRGRLAQSVWRTIEASVAIERNAVEVVTLFQRGVDGE